jgi:hypothetical protein
VAEVGFHCRKTSHIQIWRLHEDDEPFLYTAGASEMIVLCDTPQLLPSRSPSADMVSSSSVVTINYKGESAELSSTYKKNHVLGGTPLFKGFIR